MIFLVKKTIRNNNPEKTIISEFFNFFKNEKALQDYKSYEVKECLKEQKNTSIFVDGDNLTFEMHDVIKEIELLSSFKSEKDGLIYLAKYKGLDTTPFESLPETIWFS